MRITYRGTWIFRQFHSLCKNTTGKLYAPQEINEIPKVLIKKLKKSKSITNQSKVNISTAILQEG